MNEDKKAQEVVEHKDAGSTEKPARPEGPHAKERLTDREKTPGSGSLPDDATKEADVGPD